MLLKKPHLLVCGIMFALPKFSKNMDNVPLQIQSAMAFGGITLTKWATRFIKKNEKIKQCAPNFGVSSGELAVVTGLMGGLLSLENSLPGSARHGLWIPILYGCYKLSNNKIFNRIIENAPNIGKYLASQDTRLTKETLGDPLSPIYNYGNKNYVMPQRYQEIQQIKGYEGPTHNNVQKSIFATTAITIFFYKIAKPLLKKSFNYPDCLINWGGQVVGKAVNFIINK